MTNLRKAAIELLKSAPDHIDGHWPELDEVCKALAQPEQELDYGIDRGAWSDVPDATKWVDELRGDEDSEQEPVLWKWSGDGWSYEKPAFPATPLYAAPPSKPWVSLSDEQTNDIKGRWVCGEFESFADCLAAIEAALRSKNNG